MLLLTHSLSFSLSLSLSLSPFLSLDCCIVDWRRSPQGYDPTVLSCSHHSEGHEERQEGNLNCDTLS